MEHSLTLIERLVRLAELWASENDRSLSRLATVVVNDGKLFERIAGGGSCTVATFERFIQHLNDPENWSNGIPAEARELIISVGTQLQSPTQASAA